MASIAAQMDAVVDCNDMFWDFSNLSDFDENLCAALGVLVSRWQARNRCVQVRLNGASVLPVIKRNSFLGELEIPHAWYNHLPGLAPDRNIRIEDANQQVHSLPYRRIKKTDVEAQAAYVSEVVNEDYWPRMTPALKEALTSCILEVFNNAEEHSESEAGVFVCGYVGKAGQRQLRISIADAGIGFRAKIEKALGKKLSSCKAIVWGMTEGNTVRKGNPGGLGLKLLREFINKNDGKLSVLSDRGYWELSAGKERVKELDNSFPGTLVTIVVNTDDPKSYRLVSEV
ncbi:MAG: ATP-binding protein [bacterium]|nr:ATP-binding protein [bacterium]